MTPSEEVREQFAFVDWRGEPIDLRGYQATEVNAGAQYDRFGLYWEPGAGKTFGSTVWALSKTLRDGIDHWVITMPPILLDQWAKFLSSIRWKRDGAPVSVTVYHEQYAKAPDNVTAKAWRAASATRKRGTVRLDTHFLLTSLGLFKNDYERIYTHFQGKRVGLIQDEATAVKNIESDNYKSSKDFADAICKAWMPLTGTPVSKPMDAYAYIRMLTGKKIYRNKRAFEKLHVEEFDDYDRPVAYKNLDLLADNMKVQSSRILRREVQKELPPVIHTVIPYVLADKHIELYNQLAKDKLLEYEGKETIDAISASKLRAALQQIVVNWPYFGQDEKLRPAVLDLIDETMEEIGQHKKLVVVANFRRSNAYLVEQLSQYGAVGIWGDVSKVARADALRKFLHYDACRLITLHPDAAGYGVDGLQHVCSDMLIVEAPTIASSFHQVVARLDRDGQVEPVNCRIAVAQRTVQVRMFKNLLANDSMVNAVQGGYRDLRDSIYGD